MKTNVAAVAPRTHEGGAAMPQTPLRELERAVATCLLWESTFYEQGSEIAGRIAELCARVSLEDLTRLAVRARTDLKLRHVPLWLARQACRLHQGRAVGDLVASVVQRPDEAAELVALYWRDGRTMLPKQMKRGLAVAFRRWTEHGLAKWNRDHAIKLRDVLFLIHAKPADAEQAALWKRLIAGELATADTWEVALSTGADKRATWERLLREHRLGYMALLMNLRNMVEAQVDLTLVHEALLTGARDSKALPFRFVAAAKAAPALAQACSEALLSALHDHPPLEGSTALVIDVSGSMDAPISAKSTLSRWEAAGALGALLREVCPTARVFTFSDALVEVANVRGLPLVAAIAGSQGHGGTYLRRALDAVRTSAPDLSRVIVVTDEQSHDGITSAWTPGAYLVNVAPDKPALDTTQGWARVSGWSERIVDWIRWAEADSASAS